VARQPQSGFPAPRLARAFVVAFLATMVICATLTVEAWPFTAFHLFSHVREDHQTGWSAVAIDARGNPHPYPLNELSQGYRGFRFLLVGFDGRSAGEKDAICRTWVEGAPKLIGVDAKTVNLYALSWRLSDRRGDRAAPPQRTLRYVCTAGGFK
jgi:hypothetical protein